MPNIYITSFALNFALFYIDYMLVAYDVNVSLSFVSFEGLYVSSGTNLWRSDHLAQKNSVNLCNSNYFGLCNQYNYSLVPKHINLTTMSVISMAMYLSYIVILCLCCIVCT